MKTSFVRNAAALAFVAILGVISVNAQSIVNTSFDDSLPTFTSSGFVTGNPVNWGSVTTVPYRIQSWDGVNASATFKVAAEDGAAFVGIQNNTTNTAASGIFQTVTDLTIGETYTVTFYVRARNVASEGGTFLANLSGGTAATIATGTASSTTWTSVSGQFVAASTSASFGITYRSNSGDQMLFVDNISITTAIPEPSTYALLTAVSAIALCMVARRRRS
ncbi:MAG: carbohydrate binding domain-containing protein [Opitutaceae bacterium]|jgi:hypothetical protein